MIIVYTKEKFPKQLFDTILTRGEAEISGGLFIDHPELREEDCIVVEAERYFEYPISDNLTSVREMTREEKIMIKNMEELLYDGEYIDTDTGTIITVEKEEGLLRAIWNKETHSWEEGMTVEELIETRKTKILKYDELDEQIERLRKRQNRFRADLTIELIEKEMAKLEVEIDDLETKIDMLKK